MAEFIMKALVKARGLEGLYHIESAAVSTEEIGNPIYPPAKRCLTQHGVWFDPAKTARQLTRADYSRYDLIIYMDASNLRWIRRIIPDDPDRKIRHMMSFAAGPGRPAGRDGGYSTRWGADDTCRDGGYGTRWGADDTCRDGGYSTCWGADDTCRAGGPVRALRDVADPWYTGDFEQTFQDLLEGCEGLLACL